MGETQNKIFEFHIFLCFCTAYIGLYKCVVAAGEQWRHGRGSGVFD